MLCAKATDPQPQDMLVHPQAQGCFQEGEIDVQLTGDDQRPTLRVGKLSCTLGSA